MKKFYPYFISVFLSLFCLYGCGNTDISYDDPKTGTVVVRKESPAVNELVTAGEQTEDSGEEAAGTAGWMSARLRTKAARAKSRTAQIITICPLSGSMSFDCFLIPYPSSLSRSIVGYARLLKTAALTGTQNGGLSFFRDPLQNSRALAMPK